MFHKSHVETLNPEIRQYSDLPAWIDEHSDQLKGNQVLMYCTGGIRCEMASAYIRSKGPGFGNVFQLYGGIQRYLEQFPDGGFFRGKNFVFDHRISVGSKNDAILGSCILCGFPFDDYSARCRCAYCRMLVLICDGCQKTSSKLYVCELCQKHVDVSATQPTTVTVEDEQLQESASNIPGTFQAEANISVSTPCVAPVCNLPSNHGKAPANSVSGKMLSKKLRILCLHGFRQNASSFKGRLSSFAKKLRHIAELIFIDAPHELPFIYQQCQAETRQPLPPPQNCKRRFAWLVAPQTNDFKGQDWKIADGPFDPYQYQQQTGGFDISHGYLKAKFSEMGPFDGILGFSQGAAMAASVCEEQQKMDSNLDFRFAILCSGFSPSSSERKLGSIEVPSLHVYGSSKGGDRQINCKASMELSLLFEQSCCKIIEHDMGHIIPTKAPYIDEIQDFLVRFL